MSSWIDRAIATRAVDADGVPTNGNFRTWKFIGASLTPSGDQLIIEILGGSLLTGPGGSVDVGDTSVVIDSQDTLLISTESGVEIGGGNVELVGEGVWFIGAAAPTGPTHLANKAYVDSVAGGGSGSSISQAGGSVAVDGSGGIAGTTAADQSAVITAANTGATQSAALSLDGANGDASLSCTTGAEVACGTSGAVSLRVGNNAWLRCSISGANLRTVLRDAGGADALTIDADNAASSITAVGTLAVTCATSLTETIGTATRTVTASGANRTETYGGGYTMTSATGTNITVTSAENTTINPGNNLSLGKVGGGNTEVIGTPLRLYGINRKIEVGNSSIDYLYFTFPADVTVSNGSTSTIGTLIRTGAKSGGKPTRMRFDLLVWDSAGNVTTREVRFTMRRNGANGVLVGTPYVSAAADDAVEIASLTVTVVDDAAGVLVRLANASGGSVDAGIVGFEVMR